MKLNQLIRSFTGGVLPLVERPHRLRELDQYHGSAFRLARQSALTIASSYWSQSAAAFNFWSALVQTVLIVFCFHQSTVASSLSIPTGAVLIVLAFRDAYTHRAVRSMAQCYLDSVIDGIIAVTFLIACQSFTLAISPSLALPQTVLYRGAVIGLPLIALLRMLLSPKPEMPAGNPYQGSNLTPEQIHRSAWRLNILWLVTFFVLVAMNVNPDKHLYLPDMIRGFSCWTFFIWCSVQGGTLFFRRVAITLLSDPVEMHRQWLCRTLPAGMQRGEPLYMVNVVLEGTMHFVMAMSAAEAVWPWLSGQSSHLDLARAGVSIIAFGICMLSWKHVKAMNRAAHLAILQEIEKTKTAAEFAN